MKKLTATLLVTLLSVSFLLIGVKGGAMHQAQADSTETTPQGAGLQVGMYRSIHSLTMNVIVEKALGERASITLLTQKGKVLYREVLSPRQKKRWLKLNFEEIQDGNFSVIVTKGTEQITKSIHLSTQRLYEMPARTLLVMN